ncbi:MAG: excinuclease ABC subunit UvrC, partial [bacterium]|nr:excinuclease ABC subunit UvrC [bacterium]
MNRTELKKAVQRFPQSPGVYLMKDVGNRFLYIGKALNLKKRVQSYFTDQHDARFQIPFLLDKVTLIEWIATDNETEALILESNLIKSHKPPYNLDLKDDKHFPYLKVTLNEPFPRLIVTRRVINDGARYFGPFTDAGTMRRVMDFAHTIFKIRNCKRKLPLKKPVRPCINASIGRCNGPCAGTISQQKYRQNVTLLMQFLKGQRRDLIELLKQRMETAAAKLDFEKAASLRDQINLIRKSSRLQRVDLKTPRTDFDVFGVFESGRHTCLCALLFRQGLLLSKRHFIFKRQIWDTPHADHEAVILQFYQNAVDDPPGEIILSSHMAFNRPLLASGFSSQYSQKIRLTVPQKGDKAQLVRLAKKNARLYLSQKIPDDAVANLSALKELLKLPRVPKTIEAFDISNLGDKFAVAGMVHFAAGLPDKSLYRRFKIKTVDGQNDFAMLLEAVTRRLSRLHDEKKPFPDLL